MCNVSQPHEGPADGFRYGIHVAFAFVPLSLSAQVAAERRLGVRFAISAYVELKF